MLEGNSSHGQGARDAGYVTHKNYWAQPEKTKPEKTKNDRQNTGGEKDGGRCRI